MISTAGSLRIDENNDHQHQVTCHPDSHVALLPFVLKVVILGDDVIGVRERFPSHLERDPMVPLIALRFRRVPGESRIHAFTIVYSLVNHSNPEMRPQIRCGPVGEDEVMPPPDNCLTSIRKYVYLYSGCRKASPVGGHPGKTLKASPGLFSAT